MKINKKFLIKIFLTAAAVILQTGFAFAQEAATAEEGVLGPTYYKIIGILFFVLILAIIIAFLYFGTEEIKEEEKAVSEPARASLWARFRQAMTKATPIEKEGEILMEDDYDGIKELDNRIPPWFNYLFYATILFGIYYLFNYEVFSAGKSQVDEYNAEMQAAAAKKAKLEASGVFLTADNVTRLMDTPDLEAGKAIFKTNCVPCHGPEAGGIVGPNLTDKYWIHGGGIKNVFKTIKDGVPAKGMISWQAVLKPKQIQEVASYVLSLQGTKPANPKAPQGTIWEGDSTQVSQK
jgi:cytochrome c oxidase cbb3-type subunit 3